jgi:hypothetical protein
MVYGTAKAREFTVGDILGFQTSMNTMDKIPTR